MKKEQQKTTALQIAYITRADAVKTQFMVKLFVL